MENELLAGKKFPLDLLIIILFSVIGALFALALPDGNIIRIIFGIPLLFFSPGYAFVSVLWPHARLNNSKADNGAFIDNLERIALSLGLSLVLVSIIGFVMSYFTGINLTTSLLSNLGFVIIASGLAYFLREKLPENERFSFSLYSIIPGMPDNKTEKLFIGIIAVMLAISMITVTVMLITPSIDNVYTEFYILDSNGTAENYPVNLTINDTAEVIVGIVSHEYQSTDYDIIIGIEGSDGIVINSWSQPFNMTSMNQTSRGITLPDGGIFEENFSFYFDNPGTYKVVWELMIDGEETDYSVHLWVEVQ